jgi:hypothetical protein
LASARVISGTTPPESRSSHIACPPISLQL